MKKRVISGTLAILLAFLVLPIGSKAAGNFSNFTVTRTYTPGLFSDVKDEWFAEYVKKAYEFGLIDGTSVTTYSPKENLTVAQAIKLASCLHSIYTTGTAGSFSPGTPWYQPYVDYALKSGIISSPYPDYNVNATRAEFAVILSKALPDEALTAINTIGDNQIPDVLISYTYGPSVYKLYKAGVLTGSDSAGTFYPDSFITRDAVAAIIARMAIPSLRQKVSLPVTGSGVAYYPGLATVPDFGAYTGAPLYKAFDDGDGRYSFYYRISDLTVSADVAIAGYYELLERNGYSYVLTTNNIFGDEIIWCRSGVNSVWFGRNYCSDENDEPDMTVPCVMVLVMPI